MRKLRQTDETKFKLADLLIPRTRPSLLIFLLLLGAVFAFSVHKRQAQFEYWKSKPQAFFVDGEPVISTTDAGYYLMAARGYAEFGENANAIHVFPYAAPKGEAPERAHNITTPLLSVLIAEAARFTDWNYSLAANLMIPWLASLFIIPFGLFFYRLRLPVAGLLGALVGALALGYFGRTSVGRVDTDMLNLFFPSMMALAILSAALAKSDRVRYAWAGVSGLTMFLFMWWYPKTGFVGLYMLALVGTLLAHKIHWKKVAIATGVFLLLAGPMNLVSSVSSLQSFARSYAGLAAAPAAATDSSAARFTSRRDTVSESKGVTRDRMFKSVMGSPSLIWLGLTAFALFALLHWRSAIALAPIAGLGLMSFFSGVRFTMYLAPLVGIGLGIVLTAVIRAVGIGVRDQIAARQARAAAVTERPGGAVPRGNKQKKGKQSPETRTAESQPALEIPAPGIPLWRRPILAELATYAIASMLIFDMSGNVKADYKPSPKVSAPLQKAFMAVGKKTEEDAVLLTWWDYGYTIMDASRRAVIHHGGVDGPQTYFVARGLVSSSMEELSNISRFLVAKGLSGIREANTSVDGLLTAVTQTTDPDRAVYIMYTRDMIRKFGALAKIGNRDLRTGKRGWNGRFKRLKSCSIKSKMLKCKGYKVDLATGIATGKKSAQLARVVFEKNDKVTSTDWDAPGGRTIQIHRTGKRLREVFLLNENTYASNFNQMFLLGRTGRQFKQVFKRGTLVRLFKVKTGRPRTVASTTGR
ncbi:MAG: MFS family permease [Myxococcota bacterium]